MGGYLEWEVKAPSGTKVFTAFFSGDVGRKTLPETGTYTVHFWIGKNDSTLLGKYAFKISALLDSTFGIDLGQTVTNGVPGQGAGQIETAGGQDLYSFTGNAGQKIKFQSLYAAPAFGGYLRVPGARALQQPGGPGLSLRPDKSGVMRCRKPVLIRCEYLWA